MKKIVKDFILLAVLLLTAGIFAGIQSFNRTKDTGVVRVIQNGEEIAIYPLNESITVSIPCDEGYNLLLISNGKASISDADCRDGICVRQKEISQNGESIICLPHKLVICVESGEESGLDAVSY